MSDGKIEITFEGLCPFFTKHLPELRLMVGLIGVYEASEIMHVPTLAIFEEGFPEPVIYRGNTSRRLLTGDVFLHVRSNDNLAASDIVADDTVKLLNVESLYNLGTLDVHPERCQAKLHFNNGVLSQIESNLVKFEDQDGNLVSHPAGRFSYNVKLKVLVPEQSYAVLHFDVDTDDFVFKAGRNYTVAITSLPQSGNHDHPMNHFQYYYRLAGNIPETMIVPEKANPGDSGDPTCMLGDFSGTDY